MSAIRRLFIQLLNNLRNPGNATMRQKQPFVAPQLNRRNRPWSCENVSAEGERRRHLNLACCPNCELESRWLARSAVSDLVVPMDTPMRTPHVWIAAMRGFTPRMFMARVRL